MLHGVVVHGARRKRLELAAAVHDVQRGPAVHAQHVSMVYTAKIILQDGVVQGYWQQLQSSMSLHEWSAAASIALAESYDRIMHALVQLIAKEP